MAGHSTPSEGIAPPYTASAANVRENSTVLPAGAVKQWCERGLRFVLCPSSPNASMQYSPLNWQKSRSILPGHRKKSRGPSTFRETEENVRGKLIQRLIRAHDLGRGDANEGNFAGQITSLGTRGQNGHCCEQDQRKQAAFHFPDLDQVSVRLNE